MDAIVEASKKIPITKKVDVLVVGGGPGGFPAAVAAARRGAKTLLVERYGFLGGLATSDLVGPLHGYATMSGRKILGGIPQEIVHRMIDLGGASKDLTHQGGVPFDPEILKYVADSMVEEAGVQILFHSLATNTIVESNNIKAVIIENKSGRQAVVADIVIDATGDGDIAAFAGAPFEKGRSVDGMTEPMGTMFRIGGVKALTADERKKAVEIVGEAIRTGKIRAFHPRNGQLGSTIRTGETTMCVTRFAGDGNKVEELTRAEIQIRKDTLDIVKFYRENVPGYESIYLLDTPAQVGVRETRQIIGEYVLNADDVLKVRKFDDAVARGAWFIDIHCPLGRIGPYSHVCSSNCKIEPPCKVLREHKDKLLDEIYLPKDEWYDIPYRCLVPKKIDNLLVSGRCASFTHEAMAATRVMGTCMAIGQAVGTAAALAVDGKVKPRELDVSLLQNALIEDGVPLGQL